MRNTTNKNVTNSWLNPIPSFWFEELSKWEKKYCECHSDTVIAAEYTSGQMVHLRLRFTGQ